MFRGESVGLIGASGSGKSTLVDLFLGILDPQQGRICMDDVDVHENLRNWQSQIGYVPQTIYLTDDTLRRNIAFGLSEEEIDDDAVVRAIEAAQLDEFVASLAGQAGNHRRRARRAAVWRSTTAHRHRPGALP